MANLTPDQLDITALEFGKWAGSTPEQIADLDPGYVVWLYEEWDGAARCSRALYLACDEKYDKSLEDVDFRVGVDRG